MTNTNTGNGKQSRIAKTVAMLLLLVLLFSAQAPEAAAIWWIKSDWSKVQAVTPGTRTTVLLYKDLAPRGKRKIKGHLQSVTADAVTLLLPDGQTRSVAKEDVRRVLVRRPFKKRYQGWVTAGIATAIAAPLFVAWPPAAILYIAGAHVAPATAIGFLVAPKKGGIYNVPRNHSKSKTQATSKRQRPFSELFTRSRK